MCGKILSSNYAKGDKYLRCSTRDISKELCKGATIKCSSLEEIILEKIQNLSLRSFDTEYIDKNIVVSDRSQDILNVLMKRQSEAEKKLNEFELMSKNAYMDKVNGLITASQFVEFNSMFMEDAKKQKMLIETISLEIKIQLELHQKKQSQIDKIEKYKNVDALTRLIVLDLIDEIRIGVKDKTTRKTPIEILWNF